MKSFYLLLLSCVFMWMHSFAQTPGVKWLRYNTTQHWDGIIYDCKPTNDKGFIQVGVDSCNYDEGSILNRTSRGILTVMKTDSANNVIWRKPTANSYYITGTSVDICNDGGYIISALQWNSPYNNLDSSSFYIIKMDGNGNIQWTKTFGGTKADIPYAVIEVSQGGYIVAGTTTSSNGDVADNHNSASSDAWVVKLDASGTVEWKKCFGGNGMDSAYNIIETPDHGFVIAGVSASTEGDLTGNKGKSDGWLLKIDGLGNIQWQKNIGGTNDDCLRSLALTEDGAIIAVGYTLSNDGDVSGNHGGEDMWLVKCSMAGDFIWSKCFGGTQNEYGLSVQRTLNNEFLAGGFTRSNDGDITANNGGADGWLILASTAGNLIWEKTIGTINDEFGVTAKAISGNQFVLSGTGTAPWFTHWRTSFLALLGNANTIKGNVFLDANLNGTRDNGEPGFNGLQINVEKDGATHSTQPYNGKFAINTDIGSFTSSFVPNSSYFSVVPASHISSFASYFNTDSFDIAVQPLSNQQDLGISILPLAAARPGFSSTYRIIYSNSGTVAVNNVSVRFVKDAHTTFTSASIIPASVTADTLQWNFAAVNPQDSASIELVLTIATPPVVNIGDKLNFMGVISPVAGDITPADDTTRLKQIVVGSYDPNDKTEANGGVITRKQLTEGEYLNYLIRFQNTGTDTAFSVTIKDTLDNKLDWASLQMLGSSHSYQLSVANSNQLTWLFNDIRLVDSNRNEPASHGYIAYRIKPKATLTEGDIVNNTASIYFDFNLPVPTNTERTALAAEAILPVSLLKWNAALNNDKVVLNWQTSYESNIDYYEVQYSTDGSSFTGIGKLTARNSTTGSSYSLNHFGFVTGKNFYRLATKEFDGSVHYSNVLIIYATLNKEIVSSVYPNPAKGAITVNMHGDLKGMASFTVSDLSGKQVLSLVTGNLSTSSYSTVINAGALSSGMYIITIRLNGYLEKQKLIISK